VTVIPVEHPGQERVEPVQDRVDRRRHRGLPGRYVNGLAERPSAAAGRVVAEHVHPAETVEGQVSEQRDSTGVGDVRCDTKHLGSGSAQGRVRVPQGGLVGVRKYQAHVLLGKCLG
jgi:hypothetical protein